MSLTPDPLLAPEPTSCLFLARTLDSTYPTLQHLHQPAMASLLTATTNLLSFSIPPGPCGCPRCRW